MKIQSIVFVLLCLCTVFPIRTKAKDIPDDKTLDEIVDGSVELAQIERAVANLNCPMTLGAAIAQIGGESALQYRSGVDRFTDKTFERYYNIVTPHLKEKGYVVVFVGDEFIVGEKSIVKKVRIGYYTPTWALFYADLSMLSVNHRKEAEVINQRPEGTPGKSPSSNPSQVPGAPHP